MIQELANGTANARDLNRDLSRFSSPTPILDRLGGEKFKDQDDGAASCQLLNHFVYTAEYALRDIRKPMGVSQYEGITTKSLPKRLQQSLPSIQEIEAELSDSATDTAKNRLKKKRVKS